MLDHNIVNADKQRAILEKNVNTADKKSVPVRNWKVKRNTKEGIGGSRTKGVRSIQF